MFEAISTEILFGFQKSRDIISVFWSPRTVIVNRDNMTTSDGELLRAYAEIRSETAFAGFVERRIGFVYATALRETGGDAHLAQDVAQAVFSLVAKKAGALAGHERLAGWLYTTTTHIARRERRNAQTRVRYEQEGALMNALQKNENDDSADLGKLRPLLNDALDTLRRDERETVLLRFFEGRTFGEIGARLKMSEDAARMRVTRAVEKMRTAFAKRGVTSSAAALGALLAAEAAHAAPAGLAATVSSGAISAAGAGAVAAGALATAMSVAADVLMFMSTTKVMMIAAATLVLAIGGAFYGAHSVRAAEKSLAEAKRENSVLRSRARAVEEQAKTTQAEADVANMSREERVALGEAFLDAHPKMKQALYAYGKAKTAGRFYRLRSELGMTDEQWEEFLRIRGKIADGFGYGITNPKLGRYNGMIVMLPKPGESWREEMRALLGDDGYARFEEEEKRGPSNESAHTYMTPSNYLAAALYFTDSPLSAAQARQLDELVIREVGEGKSLMPQEDRAWNAVCEQASGFLSEPQIEALKKKRSMDTWTRDEIKNRQKIIGEMLEAQQRGGKNK